MLISVTRDGKMRIIKFPEQLAAVCDIPEAMELVVLERSIVLRPRSEGPRRGWAGKFAIMHDRDEDAPVLNA